MWATRKDVNTLYDRVRTLEHSEIHMQDVETKIDTFLEMFRNHDENEMKKYDKINERLSRLEKFMWLLMGAGFVVQFILPYIKIGG